MPGERAIHVTMFVLILIGLCSLSAWISYKFLEELILQVAAIALSWGVTLLVLYIGFKVLGWDWWSEHAQRSKQTLLSRESSPSPTRHDIFRFPQNMSFKLLL